MWSSEEMLIDCVDTDGLPPLIGVRNFLKDFKITIDYPRKAIMNWDSFAMKAIRYISENDWDVKPIQEYHVSGITLK